MYLFFTIFVFIGSNEMNVKEESRSLYKVTIDSTPHRVLYFLASSERNILDDLKCDGYCEEDNTISIDELDVYESL